MLHPEVVKEKLITSYFRRCGRPEGLLTLYPDSGRALMFRTELLILKERSELVYETKRYNLYITGYLILYPPYSKTELLRIQLDEFKFTDCRGYIYFKDVAGDFWFNYSEMGYRNNGFVI